MKDVLKYILAGIIVIVGFFIIIGLILGVLVGSIEGANWMDKNYNFISQIIVGCIVLAFILFISFPLILGFIDLCKDVKKEYLD